MSDLELIDRLCTVIEQLSEIVRKQAIFIEEQLTVDDETKGKLRELRDAADDELDIIECDLRNVIR